MVAAGEGIPASAVVCLGYPLKVWYNRFIKLDYNTIFGLSEQSMPFLMY